jgi:dCMP deaminase
MKSRVSFLSAALETAKIWASRSEDLHKKVGACILNKEGRVLSLGYNGLAPKLVVDDNFWENRDFRRDYVIHAEVNALALIKKQDEPYLIATTLLPCSHCAINIACYGIKIVVYNEEYEKDQKAKDIFKFYNIELIKI